MHKPRALALALVTILAGALLSASPSSTASAPDPEKAKHPDHIRFVLLQTDPEQSNGPIAAYGSIHSAGANKVLGPFKDLFAFPAGDLIVRHRPSWDDNHFDPKTCQGWFEERGRWTVDRGTDKYDDADGQGTYRVRADFVACNPEQEAPRIFLLKIVATGQLSY